MKKIVSTILLAMCAGSILLAEKAEVRMVLKDGKKLNPVSKTVELEKVSADKFRIVIPKESIPENAKFVEVIPEFAKANKGDDGYWMQARGTYGKFDKDNGFYSKNRQLMPIYAVKKGETMFWGHVKTWRFDYDFVARVQNGKYEVYPRFRVDGVKEYFQLYNDIVIEFNKLEGDKANYNEVAKAYQKFQLDNKKVRTIKDRVKDYPMLDYLCESIVIRIQTHCAKPISDTKIDFTKETEWPIVVHMPFGVSEEFVKAIKDAGVDKATIVSAGWNYGGYDGRTPQHLPVEAAAGGEEAYLRLVKKTQDLGYQFTLHATNTDGYTVSPKWDTDWVGKKRDGSLVSQGLWAGGKCYLVCQNCSYHKWAINEIHEMAKLGAKGPHYIDVYSATYPNRCADKNHPATPEQMAEYQNKILAESKKVFGGASSESGYDHVAGNIDYINYIERDIKNMWDGKQNKLISGIYPVWELVYHGIILYNSDRATQNHTRGKCMYKLEKSGDPRWMEGDGILDPRTSLKIVEFGGRPIFYTYKFADVPRIKRAWDEFKPVRHLQKEMMVGHDTIADNVFITKFGDGSQIISNYNKEPFSYSIGSEKVAKNIHGKGSTKATKKVVYTINPISYILINPDGSVFTPKPF